MIANHETFELTVVETSDVHGHAIAYDERMNKPTAFGLTKAAPVIQRLREKGHVLLIDNGDVIQGTPLTYYEAKRGNDHVHPMVRLYNALQYDAAVFGNHEFNFGLNMVQNVVNTSHFPWLAANIVDIDTHEPYFGQPYIIRTYENGIKVAVLGVTTSYIPHWENPINIEGLAFLDVVETVQRWMPYLRDEQACDIVIVSYHGGFECDLETGKNEGATTDENVACRLCEQVPDIDVLLTGHQHRHIVTTINGVTVIQPGHYAQAVGAVALTCTRHHDRWVITDRQATLYPVDEEKEDDTLARLVDDNIKALRTWLSQPIGRVEGDMRLRDPFYAKQVEHPLVEWINRVQMDVAGVDISCTSLLTDHAPGLFGEVTMRDILANYIFPNTLKVLRLTGADIRSALERSASYFDRQDGELMVNRAFSFPKPQHYNYDMWEGIDYVIDASKPVGERVTTFTYHGEPVKDDSSYDVVMNNYRAGGGGDYTMFENKPVIKDIPVDMAEYLARDIETKGIIQATVNHNWKVI